MVRQDTHAVRALSGPLYEVTGRSMTGWRTADSTGSSTTASRVNSGLSTGRLHLACSFELRRASTGNVNLLGGMAGRFRDSFIGVFVRK